jgi:transposase InsO family protein
MTAKIVRQWLASVGAKTLYIAPGSPWENGYCESFMYRRPPHCKDFDDELQRSGAFMYSAYRCSQIMAAGPDGVRGLEPHQRVAL